MALFLDILVTVLLPLFLLIGVGVLADRLIRPDVVTLARLNYYVLLPALLFVGILDAELDVTQFGAVVAFSAVHLLLLLGAGWLLLGVGPLRPHRPVLVMAAAFYNAGNYGLPFATLAFGSGALGVMALVIMVQNVATFTIGLWLMGRRDGWRGVLRESVRAPVLYAILAALLIAALGVEVPEFLRRPAEILADGVVSVALIGLGVQLSRVRLSGNRLLIAGATLARLVLSPLLAAGLGALGALVLPQLSTLAPVLVVAAGLPAAVNVFVLAVEYDREPDLASQLVFWTTLLSVFTLTAWLALVRQWFGH